MTDCTLVQFHSVIATSQDEYCTVYSIIITCTRLMASRDFSFLVVLLVFLNVIRFNLEIT